MRGLGIEACENIADSPQVVDKREKRGSGWYHQVVVYVVVLNSIVVATKEVQVPLPSTCKESKPRIPTPVSQSPRLRRILDQHGKMTLTGAGAMLALRPELLEPKGLAMTRVRTGGSTMQHDWAVRVEDPECIQLKK